MHDEISICRTSDLGLVSALYCLGIQPDSITKDNKIVYFLFTHQGIDKHVENYWSGKFTVDANKHYNQIKAIRTMIYGILDR